MELIFKLFHWIKEAVVPFELEKGENWGQLGDWIGGIGGTFLTFVSLIALVLTLRLSRAAMMRQSIYALFATMSKTHDDLTASFQMSNSKGSDVFRILLKDFDVCLKAAAEHYPELGTRQTIDLAYSMFFYGSTITGREYLNGAYDSVKVNNALNHISEKRNRLARIYPKSKGHRLSGNQARLSNYYRNLYGIYAFINESKLPDREKCSILKTVRTKMSNHEQALLALNICSHLGTRWEDEKLVIHYEPIKNIPKGFLILPDKTPIEDLFPEVNFEFEQRQETKTFLLNIEFYGISASIKLRRAGWAKNLFNTRQLDQPSAPDS